MKEQRFLRLAKRVLLFLRILIVDSFVKPVVHSVRKAWMKSGMLIEYEGNPVMQAMASIGLDAVDGMFR